VFVNNAAVQSERRFWSDDRLEWRPKRWLEREAKENSYIPWAGGPRVCPGKKFSQVEHTAAIACLFHRHRVSPVLEPSESLQQARERLMVVINDSDMALAMKMNHAEKLRVKWEWDGASTL
jgi:cytochrome P450